VKGHYPLGIILWALSFGYWIEASGLCTKISELKDTHIIAIKKFKELNDFPVPKRIKDEYDRRNVNGWMELIS